MTTEWPMTRTPILAVAAAVLALSACQAAAGGTVTPAPQQPGQCHSVDGKADRRCTPGAFNPDVTQDTIGRTICVRGWTATVRPPASYTNRLKTQEIKAYGYADTNPRSYEEDHLVPLEIGGAPSDPRNLWPEPGASPNPKDREENQLHDAVCAGRMTLDAARQRIVADWAAP